MDLQITDFDSRLMDKLNKLPPPEWQSDAYELFLHNEWQPWFFPYQTVSDNKLIGFGMYFLFEENAWLGWILVHKKYRNRGIGNAITKHLIEEARKRGAANFFLTASGLGFPVYKKLGFLTTSNYRFYHLPERFNPVYDKPNIRIATKNNLSDIFQLDLEATGEKRSVMIESHLDDIWVYNDNILKGFYISNFGNGFIAAKDEKTGIELINFKCKKNTQPIVLPDSNKAAIEYLQSKGFKEYLVSPRMTLGKEPNWNPALIYSRATGYCG